MKKSTIIKSVLFLMCFSWANAQEKYPKNDAKTIVMTQTEYHDFIAKIKELRRQKLKQKNQKVEKVHKIQVSTSDNKSNTDLLRELNDKVNYLLYTRNSGNATQFVPYSAQNGNNSDYLRVLQEKIDALKNQINTKKDPQSYTAEFDDLTQKITELESKLSAKHSKEVVTITNASKYDELMEKYSNYRKAYFFGNNSSEILSSDYYSIDEVASIIKNGTPHIKIQLKGFASKVGSPIYNAKLSKRRTESVKNLLIKKGVNPSFIEILPLGEDHTAYSDAQARRVDLSLFIIK